MFIGISSLPQALVCDVTWFFSYPDALRNVNVETADITSNNAAIVVIIASLWDCVNVLGYSHLVYLNWVRYGYKQQCQGSGPPSII